MTSHTKRPFLSPTAEQLQKANRKFKRVEGRWRDYEDASKAVSSSLDGPASGLVAALHKLLLTWNRRFYATHSPTDPTYLGALANLLDRYRGQILHFRNESIQTFSPEDDEALVLFVRFSRVLGPVGASKALHLLAPAFFTIWDNWIAGVHGMYPNQGGWEHYSRLMVIRQKQCRHLDAGVNNPLKLLDEFEYLLFSKGLIGDEQFLRELALPALKTR